MTTPSMSDAGMDRLRDAIRERIAGGEPRPIYPTPEGAILALADSVRRAADPGTGAVQVMSLVFAAAQYAPAWAAEAWRDLVRHQSELLDQTPARVEADYRTRVAALLRAFPPCEPAPLTLTDQIQEALLRG